MVAPVPRSADADRPGRHGAGGHAGHGRRRARAYHGEPRADRHLRCSPRWERTPPPTSRSSPRSWTRVKPPPKRRSPAFARRFIRRTDRIEGSRPIMRRLLLTLLVLLGAALSVRADAPPPGDFQCYELKPRAFDPVPVTVTDRFGTLAYPARFPHRLCAPADQERRSGPRPSPDGIHARRDVWHHLGTTRGHPLRERHGRSDPSRPASRAHGDRPRGSSGRIAQRHRHAVLPRGALRRVAEVRDHRRCRGDGRARDRARGSGGAGSPLRTREREWRGPVGSGRYGRSPLLHDAVGILVR